MDGLMLMGYENIYDQRFGWHQEDYISNFKQLAEITNKKSLNPLDSFRCLFTPFTQSHLDSISYSILLLTYEATICYTYGIFQSCIIVCGAILERILRFEYLKENHEMPDSNDWTLGRLIYKLNWTNTKVTNKILELAKIVKKNRDDRSHANLEQNNPDFASYGGNRGITFIDSTKYLIEPYRGEAKLSIESLFKILDCLYSSHLEDIK
jgi:hypothetical protein